MIIRMSMCFSGILISAMTGALVLSDIIYSNTDRIPAHLILGGIVSLLFFALCQRGYEMINWGLLLLIPMYMIISSLLVYILNIKFSSPQRESDDDYDNCNVCRKPRRKCGCTKTKDHRRHTYTYELKKDGEVIFGN